MDACAMRPTFGRDKPAFGPVHLACLAVALALHLALLWLMQGSRPAPVTPPEPITLSARWAGESDKDDAPAKPAAPAATPAPPREVKKPAPVPPKVVKPVVKKPAPKPAPTPPKPKPVPMTKPAPVAKAELMTRSWDSKLVREMLTRTRADGGVINADDYRPEGLEKEFGMGQDGLYRLSETQAQEILQMRLQRLTGLEQDKIVAEYKEVMAVIEDLLDILAKPERVSTIIGEELTSIKQEFGQHKLGARRSIVEYSAQDLSTEDLITPTDMVVTLSHTGYIKSQPLSEYRAQKRGGRGKQATATKEDDWIDQLFIANTHDYILCFSNRGRLYWLKVWEVPAGSRGSRGRPIVNMFPLQDGEKINVVLPLTGDMRSFPADRFVFMATSMGTVKKTALDEFSNPRKGGIIAVNLDDGDYLIGAALTDGKHDVMLFSDGGKAVRFDENDVRPLGRAARGVRGMMLEEGQSVIAMLVAEDESQSVLTATENGYGKRTSIVEYTRHGRGTKGMIAIQQSERNGKVVAATLVHADDEIMLITDKGVLVRTRVSEIRELGRATQGVTLIALDEGSKLSGLQRIVENDANAPDSATEAGDESEGGNASEGGTTPEA